MGFWDKTLQLAGDLGTTLVESVNSQANEIREIKSDCEQMADEELFGILESRGLFGQSDKKKGIVFSILKKRGYEM